MGMLLSPDDDEDDDSNRLATFSMAANNASASLRFSGKSRSQEVPRFLPKLILNLPDNMGLSLMYVGCMGETTTLESVRTLHPATDVTAARTNKYAVETLAGHDGITTTRSFFFLLVFGSSSDMIF